MSVIEDENWFPVFVASGFDVYGLTEPLYLLDGMTMYPDGRIEHEDDLEDMLNEVRGKKKLMERDAQNNYFDDNEDLDFSESRVASAFQSFNEHIGGRALLEVTNNINFALIQYLGELPPEHIDQSTLIDAAINAGNFSSKQCSQDFSERVRGEKLDDSEIYETLFQDYGLASSITHRALGYSHNRESLLNSIKAAKQYITDFSEASPYEQVHVTKLATNLQKEDLAKTVIRLTIGEVGYQELPRAAMLSHLAFLEL
jgi:hypothetical protein